MEKPLVVLLHGLFRTRYSMALIERSLQRNGYRTYNHQYKSRHFPISTHAQMLNEALCKVVRPNENLSFVTHSLGSIILRKLVHEYGGRYKFSRAVMLGPPNKGSRFADSVRRVPLVPLFLGSSYLELCQLNLPDSTDAIEIGIIAGGKRSSRGYSPWINGDNDGIVAVDETYLHGAKDHRIIPMLHSFFMYSQEVRNEVLHFLEYGSFSSQGN